MQRATTMDGDRTTFTVPVAGARHMVCRVHTGVTLGQEAITRLAESALSSGGGGGAGAQSMLTVSESPQLSW